MQITASHGQRRQNGFTLLEVLVVILMIGIVLGIAVINLPRDNRDHLAIEAERFDALIGLASQQAVIGNRELALALTTNGYRFLSQDDKGDWQPITTGVLRPRTLPEEISLDIRLEGVKLQPAGADEEQAAGQIYLLSSGEITPFELTLQTTGEAAQTFRITVTIDGRHRIEEES